MIHPTAIVHPQARLDPSVRVGPYSVIDEGVEIAAGCVLGPHVYPHPRSAQYERGREKRFPIIYHLLEHNATDDD
jgi:hypothetical protein